MPMQYRYEITPALEKLLGLFHELSAVFAQLKGKNERIWPAVEKKLKIRWTTDSNALEGSTLSFAETLFFLEEGLTVEGKPLKDFLDARNHADAIEYLMQVIKDKRPITTGLMKEINALLLSGVKSTPAVDRRGQKIDKPATPGEYKRLPNHVLQSDGTIHEYVDPVHVAAEMEALVDWINGQTKTRDPLIVAAIAYYNFVRIHPFDDGNGRGARILMNLILMKAGYIPAVLPNDRRREYISALRAADKGSLDDFISFVGTTIVNTFQSVIDDLKRSSDET